MLKQIISFLLLLSPVGLLSQSDEIRHALQEYRYNEVLALLENEPPTRENLLLKADCHEKLYRYVAALEIYRELLTAYPDDLNLTISMAECASQAGDPKQSLHYWLMADSLSPANLFIQIQKTMAFYRNSNWDETIEQANIALAEDSIPLLLRVVGDAYLQTSSGDSAIWYFSKAIERNPTDYLAVYKLGSIYLGATFYDATINLTGTYLEHVNQDQSSIGQLNGMAHYSVGNYTEANQRLKENIALGDSSYTTCYYLGMSLYASKLYYEAIPWLERAYYQQNTDVNLLYYFGTALARTYDRKRAIEVLTEGAEKIGEFNAMLYDFDCSFADAYQRSGNHAKAIEYHKSAYRQNGNAHMQLCNIGYSYDLMKDVENAISYYERFLKTAPRGMSLSGDAFAGETGSRQTDQGETFYRAAAHRVEKLKEEQFFKGVERN